MGTEDDDIEEREGAEKEVEEGKVAEEATDEVVEAEVVDGAGAEGGAEEKDITELIWDLDTDTRIKNLTWWWWWWIFFIENPDDPPHPRQLMILWSTKNCERIVVNDYLWERSKDVEKTGEAGKDADGNYRKRRMTFDGMTAVWWYDGKRMHDPYSLERSDFTVEWKGAKGYLRPHADNVYLFSGEPSKYRVLIRRGDDEFDLRMSPWHDHISTHRFKEGHYVGKMGYQIYKIYGSLLEGHVRAGGIDEDIGGTAYFQKVTVNAPAVPWYWGIFHADDGSYLDYFNPHFGFPVWRKRADPTSFWDRGHFSLSRHMQFYDAVTGDQYEFRKGQVTIRKEVEGELPTFWVEGYNGEQRLSIKVRAYSRAYWRFEQKYLGVLRSVLYYNEYPSEMLELELTGGKREVTLKDLGRVVGNTEHAWGWLV